MCPLLDLNFLPLSSAIVLLLLGGRAFEALQPFYGMRCFSVSSHSLLFEKFCSPPPSTSVSRSHSSGCCLAADLAERFNLVRKWVKTQSPGHEVPASCDALASVFKLT